MRIPSPRRRAATAAETAVVGSVFFLFLIIIITGAVLVSRSQQVAALSREGARYASVHGGSLTQETPPRAPATTDDIFNNAIAPMAAGLGLTASDVTVELKTWKASVDGNSAPTPVTLPWDSSDKYPYVVTTNDGAARTTAVIVKVRYTFAPDVLGGTITMSSTSEIPMSY
jgi:hypothetical protein